MKVTFKLKEAQDGGYDIFLDEGQGFDAISHVSGDEKAAREKVKNILTRPMLEGVKSHEILVEEKDDDDEEEGKTEKAKGDGKEVKDDVPTGKVKEEEKAGEKEIRDGDNKTTDKAEAGDKKPKDKIDVTEAMKNFKVSIDEASLKSIMATLELDEEKAEALSGVLESVVSDNVGDIAASLAKQYNEKYIEDVKKIEEKTVATASSYIDEAMNEWFEENEPAIESGVKATVNEHLIAEMMDTFRKFNVNVPESKKDLYLESIEDKKRVEAKLEESKSEIKQLKEEVNGFLFEGVVERKTKGLSDVSRSRVRRMLENVRFTTPEKLESRLDLILETFEGQKTTKKNETLINEASDKDNTLGVTSHSTKENTKPLNGLI